MRVPEGFRTGSRLTEARLRQDTGQDREQTPGQEGEEKDK
jgi:hypothetical protein